MLVWAGTTRADWKTRDGLVMMLKPLNSLWTLSLLSLRFRFFPLLSLLICLEHRVRSWELGAWEIADR